MPSNFIEIALRHGCSPVNLLNIFRTPFLKARIHREIFLSEYFMKHSLMYISLHLIWFHEIHIKYVKRKPARLRNKEFKRGLRPAALLKKRLWRRCFPVNFVKFLKHLFYRTPLEDYFCRIERKSAFFSGNKEIAQRNAILSEENM